MTAGTSSPLRSDLRVVATLVRTELRARVRRARGDVRRLAAWTLTGGFFLVVIPWAVASSVTAFGARLGGPATPVGTVGAAVFAAVLLGGYLGASTGIGQDRLGAVGALVRTSAPPRAVVLGRLGVGILQANVLLLPVPVVLAILAASAGLPAAALVGVAVLVPYLAGLLAGRALGTAARYLGLLARLSTWTKVGLYVLVLGAVFFGQAALFGSGSASGTGTSGAALLPGRPLVAYAGAVLSPLGTAASTPGVAVAGAFVVATVLAGVATVRVERALLTRDVGDEERAATGSVAVPRLVGRSRSAAIAWRYLLRTRRDPRMVAHLSILVIAGVAFASSFVDDPGMALRMTPAAAVVGGVAVTGASYCLNPMGDDRDQLALLLTSTRTTAVFLRARVLAGAAVGIPLAVGGSVAAGLVVDPPAVVAARSVLAAYLVAVGGGIALGMGAVVPKFETRELVTVERAHPSNLGLFAYLFLVVLVVGVGLAILHWSLRGADPAGMGVAWFVYGGGLAIAGGGGYAYAVSRFDDLTLDDI